MQPPDVVARLREALTRDPRVAVRVELGSGVCWAFAVQLDEHTRGLRVHLDLGGARVSLPASRVREVKG